MARPHRGPRIALLTLAVLLTIGAMIFIVRKRPDVRQDVAPTRTPQTVDDPTAETIAQTRESSIAEVIELARDALASMEASLEDYTAHFAKQERDKAGILSERSEMDVKIQSRLRNQDNDAPMRIYLKFLAPENAAGREVIWGKDLYDGKMAVHDTSVVLSWKTLWLEPTGMLAMTGQRYPIYEIGLTRLVEKLIERGQRDIDNPDVSVTITSGHLYDGLTTELIQAKRAKPGGGDEDFSLAEIVYDPQRKLVLSYRAFGWPKTPAAEVPLLEFYQYKDVKLNVGLGKADFDVTNPSYNFP
jgi:hypothetical protein